MLCPKRIPFVLMAAVLCVSATLNAQRTPKNFTEVDLNFMHGQDSIFGKLILPKEYNREKLPVIVFVHGSGPEDYNSSGNYNYLFEEFAKIGFACFSWDKPGVGKSQGQWYEQAMSLRAAEVVAAMHKLKTVPAVDSSRIGLWGISQAGWVMPVVAENSKPSFVISVSSPVTTVVEQELYRVKSEIHAAGYSTDDIDKALVYTNQVIKMSREDRPYFEFFKLQNWIDPYKWSQIVIRGEETVYRYIHVVLQEDKAPAIEHYQCPVLALWGENDLLVPSASSAVLFKSRMKKSGNQKVLVKVIPQADHTLTYSLTGKSSDTAKRRELYKDNPAMVFAPDAVPAMTDWLRSLYK